MSHDRDFETIVREVTTSYAGYADKTAGHEVELAQRTETVRARLARLDDTDDNGILAAFREWIGFFRDRHLIVRFPPDREHPEELRFDDRRAELRLEGIEPDAMLLRIPGMAISMKAPLEALLREHWPQLTGRRFLIIDLRGAMGGTDAVYAELVPLLYTQPIRLVGCDFRASAGNAAHFRVFAEDANWPAEVRDWARRTADQMDAAPGSFVPAVPDAEVSLDEVLPRPERVGVMIDGRCGSANEEFLLMARQSRKVTLFGSPSNGCLDYSNQRPIPLPSRRFLLQVPISRSRRLPENPVDPTGILPDIPISDSEPDPIGRALAHLRRLPREG